MHYIKQRAILLLMICLSLAMIITGCTQVVTDMGLAESTVKPTAESYEITTVSEPTTTVASAVPTVTPVPTPQPTAGVTTTAVPVDPSVAIHQNALVIDTHNDTVLKIIDKNTWLPKTNLASKTSFMVDIPKLQAGGIDMATFAAYTSGYSLNSGGQDFAKANSRLLALLNASLWTISKNSRSTRQILQFSDIAAAEGSGKVGVLLSIEGAYSLHGETALELLRQYRDLGVLMLAPVWSNSNTLGAGVNEKYKDGTASAGGLTPLGAEIITEMNRLGMVVDVSHMNEETFWDTIQVSSSPIIASHSSVFSLCPNVRNLKDSQIEAIAAGGGVIQVNFHRPFLAVDESKATLTTLVDHIDYIVNLVGSDYVGLGSDFDGADMPQGLPDAAAYPKITRELVKRGYTKTDIRKILGGNSARLLKNVWVAAPAADSSVPVIEPAITMGGSVSSATPLLTATIGNPETIDVASLQVIVNGNVYAPDFDPVSGVVSLVPPIPLTEKFHVVTFTAARSDGTQARKTLIIYVLVPGTKM